MWYAKLAAQKSKFAAVLIRIKAYLAHEVVPKKKPQYFKGFTAQIYASCNMQNDLTNVKTCLTNVLTF